MKPHHPLCPWRHVAYTDSCGTCDAIRAAIAEEREACAAALCQWCRAKAPYDPTGKLPSHHVVDLAGTKCFAACEARPIRARGGS